MDLSTLIATERARLDERTAAQKRHDDAAQAYAHADLSHDGSDVSHKRVEALDVAVTRTERDLERARRAYDAARATRVAFEREAAKEEREALEKAVSFEVFTDSLSKHIDTIRDARARLAKAHAAITDALANRDRQVSRIRELGGAAEALEMERVARLVAEIVTRDARTRREPLPSVDVSKRYAFGDFVESLVTVHHEPFFADSPRRQAEAEATAFVNRNTNHRGPRAA